MDPVIGVFFGIALGGVIWTVLTVIMDWIEFPESRVGRPREDYDDLDEMDEETKADLKQWGDDMCAISRTIGARNRMELPSPPWFHLLDRGSKVWREKQLARGRNPDDHLEKRLREKGVWPEEKGGGNA